jgi:epoxyqueuosine reductase
MKEAIQTRARQLGFDLCRFTSAEPPGSASYLHQWLASGCHGEMAYLQRNADKRADPRKVLATARTIITLAVSYAGAPDAAASPNASVGLVARYARFTDYHQVLWDRLKILTDYIKQIGDPRSESMSLYYADTGPILERDLAQRAGLGFIGKHTNLISRELGNWFFVCEILTSLEIAPDNGERNRCGSCVRCIDACPTGAITAPFQLDARRCISYLTIELKGSIPVELRPAIGNRIFGCDDCLEACPWNRFARTGKLMLEHARPDLAEPDLHELLALNDGDFGQRFAGTPIARSKRRGLLRNVCVALGNTGGANSLPALRQAAQDQDPVISEHALWAIDQIKSRCQC